MSNLLQAAAQFVEALDQASWQLAAAGPNGSPKAAEYPIELYIDNCQLSNCPVRSANAARASCSTVSMSPAAANVCNSKAMHSSSGFCA